MSNDTGNEKMTNDPRIVKVKLAMIDVTEVEQRDIISQLGPFVDVYKKKFDNVKAELTTSMKSGSEKTFIAVVGERKEIESEKNERLNIDPDKGWISEYVKLMNVSKKDATENLQKMMSEGLALSPEDWLEHKKGKLEDFFNVS